MNQSVNFESFEKMMQHKAAYEQDQQNFRAREMEGGNSRPDGVASSLAPPSLEPAGTSGIVFGAPSPSGKSVEVVASRCDAPSCKGVHNSLERRRVLLALRRSAGEKLHRRERLLWVEGHRRRRRREWGRRAALPP